MNPQNQFNQNRPTPSASSRVDFSAQTSRVAQAPQASQNTPVNPPVGKSRSSKKYLPVVIILAIIAAAGIGFGVFGLVQNSRKQDQISNLETEISNKNNTISELQSKVSAINNTIPDSTDTSTAVVNVVGGPYIANDYFYVPDWGLKFKIPDELANYGYSVDYDTARQGYTAPAIGFTAMLKSDIQSNPQAAYYDNITTCAITTVTKEPAGWNSHQINGITKSFNDYTLLIWNYTAWDSCDYELNIDQVQTKIQSMFSNPENI